MCGPLKAIAAKYLIMSIVKLNDLSYFLTLTLRPDRIPTECLTDTHRFITKLFNQFVTQLKRKTFWVWSNKFKTYIKFSLKHSEIKLKYVWVIEFTDKGIAHMHILLNKFLPIKVLREEWQRIGGGQQMKISKVRSLIGVSAYVTDYILKGLKHTTSGVSGFKYFQKRYAISQSNIRPPKVKYLSINKLPLEEKLRVAKLVDLDMVYNTFVNLDYQDKVIDIPAPDNSS